MKIFYVLFIYILTSIVCFKAFSNNVYDSDFYDVNVKTFNAEESKETSINNVKHISFLQLMDKILTKKSKKKLNEIIETDIIYDQLIKNIIIENEIITDEKYIAKIKINYDKEKIVNLLRNKMINYTDIKSDPFLVISTYNINFNNIGLDKKNSFNYLFKQKIKNNVSLVKYIFPNLDSNDRYILPYEKIINDDIKLFNKILDKYHLNQLIIINFSKSNINNKIDINLKIYDNDGLHSVGNLIFNDLNFKTLKILFNYLFDEIIFYMNEWWKNKYQINNKEFNVLECSIISKNFNELVKIKKNINNLSQIKFVNMKKIKLNNNIVELFYYGNLNVLIKSLSPFNNLYKKRHECIITAK